VKLGVATVLNDEGIRPELLVKALEERRFDAIFVASPVVAEHSPIPASRPTDEAD
jgi:hypothetical protein